MKKRKTHRHRPLSFEALESRLPLAGEVLLKTSGGSLTVTGDDLANDITIEQDANVAGIFRVIGNDGETFKLNGVAYTPNTDIPNITKDIKVNLKGGADAVTITGDGIAGNVTARNIDVKTGAGSDFVEIQDANVSGKISANVGAGDTAAEGSTVEIDDVAVAKNVLVTGGKGNDHLHLSSVNVIGNVVINAKDGSDDVIVDTNFAASTIGKNLTINTGTGIKASGGQVLGGDFVLIAETTVTGNAKITTGGGADTVEIDQSAAKKATITTGKGNDDVFIATFSDAPVTVQQVSVSLGAGDDDVVIGSDGLGASKLVLNGPARSKVNGGAGLDTLDANGDLVINALEPSVTAVETVTLI